MIKDEESPVLELEEIDPFKNKIKYHAYDPVQTYSYYVTGYKDSRENIVSKSDVESINISSGISGFYYVIDNYPNTEPSKSSSFTTSYEINDIKANEYIHIVCVDHSGNLGNVIHQRMSPKPTHTPTDFFTSSFILSNSK